MELGSLKKIAWPKAAPLVNGSPLAEALTALLDDDPTPAVLLERLIDQERFLDATRFLILALPEREAVWLACLAARLAAEHVPPNEQDRRALAAAEKWVFEPGEDNRRNAQRALEGAEYSTPAALAALAAFYSGGSIAGPDLPALEAPTGVAARLVDAATALTWVADDEQSMQARARRLFAQALDVANGGSGRVDGA